MKIDFRQLGGPVFTGRPRGQDARQRLGLDAFDNSNEIVDVDIPDSVYTVTSSYFLGLFGPSVRKSGSKADFLAKYSFKVPDRLRGRLDEWIDRALRDKGEVT